MDLGFDWISLEVDIEPQCSRPQTIIAIFNFALDAVSLLSARLYVLDMLVSQGSKE